MSPNPLMPAHGLEHPVLYQRSQTPRICRQLHGILQASRLYVIWGKCGASQLILSPIGHRNRC